MAGEPSFFLPQHRNPTWRFCSHLLTRILTWPHLLQEFGRDTWVAQSAERPILDFALSWSQRSGTESPCRTCLGFSLSPSACSHSLVHAFSLKKKNKCLRNTHLWVNKEKIWVNTRSFYDDLLESFLSVSITVKVTHVRKNATLCVLCTHQPQALAQRLARSWCSVRICWMNLAFSDMQAGMDSFSTKDREVENQLLQLRIPQLSQFSSMAKKILLMPHSLFFEVIWHLDKQIAKAPF